MLKDFQREDKKEMVAKYFGTRYQKWLVYGKLALAKGEVSRFPDELRNRGIVPHFGDIFKDMRKLKQYGLDAARGYMNLFETFHNE